MKILSFLAVSLLLTLNLPTSSRADVTHTTALALEHAGASVAHAEDGQVPNALEDAQEALENSQASVKAHEEAHEHISKAIEHLEKAVEKKETGNIAEIREHVHRAMEHIHSAHTFAGDMFAMRALSQAAMAWAHGEDENAQRIARDASEALEYARQSAKLHDKIHAHMSKVVEHLQKAVTALQANDGNAGREHAHRALEHLELASSVARSNAGTMHSMLALEHTGAAKAHWMAGKMDLATSHTNEALEHLKASIKAHEDAHAHMLKAADHVELSLEKKTTDKEAAMEHLSNAIHHIETANQ
ncbi:small metal-binding protein SmbP [Methylohalobius crimeensis]|uniref:small metal-binding protein SmbP n=1 Tax=Methylohalobius crimeensis TaxID=244365 RepID=UPI0003B426A1|nr:small metal-binding protein SmbP [Methylohalobius crimeensis]